MSPVTTVSRSRLVATALYLVVWPVILFALAGSLRWIEGWIFSLWFTALSAASIVWLYRKDPALLAERYRSPGSGGQKRWDIVVIYAVMVGFIAWIALMPLDAMRFEWTPRPPRWLQAGGGLMLLASSFLIFRSFTDNTFVSPLVRIQTERKQHVVSTGVYGFVRHPMYLGAILMFVGAPLLLGSVAGLLAAALLSLLLVGRILGEEKLLVAELDGYRDYRRKVRYHLLPRIW